jgi:hypothetical protein
MHFLLSAARNGLVGFQSVSISIDVLFGYLEAFQPGDSEESGILMKALNDALRRKPCGPLIGTFLEGMADSAASSTSSDTPYEPGSTQQARGWYQKPSGV